MPELHLPIANMQEALATRAFPAVMRWNRLEGRPRTHHFDRALKAEVRDALWMLTRQWQLGEFQGDDAGSPVFAKVHVTADPLASYRPGEHAARAFDPAVPLESQVEQHVIPFELSRQVASLDIRSLMGREWIQLLKDANLHALVEPFKHTFPIVAPDPASRADDSITAHRGTWQRFAALAGGRAMDGFAWLQRMTTLGSPRDFTVLAPDIVVDSPTSLVLTGVCDKFLLWYQRLLLQPSGEEGAWKSERLEYQFACASGSADTTRSFRAKEYYQGHLDWYNLDLSTSDEPRSEGSAERTDLLSTFLPTPVGFSGMPNTRWWAFEDHRTNFGGITPDSTDLVKLVVMEFGLVYANDWFSFPVRLDVGQWCQVQGLLVTNVFGERMWITAASRDLGTDRDWTLFTPADDSGGSTSPVTGILLLPTVPKVQEGDALEAFAMVRDEVANMVWAMETVAPMPDGRGRPGKEAASELRTRLQKRIDDARAAGTVTEPHPLRADIRFRLMTSVPDHWIPFVSAHMPGDTRQTRLQRASMCRILRDDPDPPRKVKPRGQLLREGLDSPTQQPYFLHEEEVPRAGIVVTRAFQRTRWLDGRVITWVGMSKQTGRGEGSSGLRFDLLQPRRDLFQPLVTKT
jgi:hypothetical protein